MALIITDDTLEKAQTTADELLIDLACYLYEKKRAKRDIYIHYSEEDLKKDLENLGINL